MHREGILCRATQRLCLCHGHFHLSVWLHQIFIQLSVTRFALWWNAQTALCSSYLQLNGRNLADLALSTVAVSVESRFGRLFICHLWASSIPQAIKGQTFPQIQENTPEWMRMDQNEYSLCITSCLCKSGDLLGLPNVYRNNNEGMPLLQSQTNGGTWGQSEPIRGL